ncbi:MAG: AtpZ/AtpI family protein [Bacillota bacterium]
MDDGRDRRWTANSLFSAAFTSGLTLAAAFAIGFYGGQWLDRHLGTYPWLTFIGLGLGVTAGFRTVLRELVPDIFRPRTKKPKPGRGEGDKT